ncbi:MAG: hypothetical protein A2293_01930 [Elusimicrobia bacterium RIFOXYB2_FULL_49_7]|nr:MAG: hypothetical protein A2293_01930 [Elusimicrobia bacterium RIFOXYB2_FULL_49_7]
MSIAALEIKRQSFKRIFKGYDPEEVQTFLDMVSEQFERLTTEKNESADRVKSLEMELVKLRNLENSLKETLDSGRRNVDEMKESAGRNAMLIVKEAEVEAASIKAAAFREKEALQRETLILAEQKKTFLIRMKALLGAQLDIINIFDKEEKESPLP